MDVALPANRRGVSEALGDGLDGTKEVLFRLRPGIEFFEFLKGHRGEDSPGPGPKIFGREIARRDLPQVFVDVI
jgi:hypothetical protein